MKFYFLTFFRKIVKKNTLHQDDCIVFYQFVPSILYYSRTSVARTLMARLPWPFRPRA